MGSRTGAAGLRPERRSLVVADTPHELTADAGEASGGEARSATAASVFPRFALVPRTVISLDQESEVVLAGRVRREEEVAHVCWKRRMVVSA